MLYLIHKLISQWNIGKTLAINTKRDPDIFTIYKVILVSVNTG